MDAAVLGEGPSRPFYRLGRVLVVGDDWREHIGNSLDLEGFETFPCDAGARIDVLLERVRPDLVVIGTGVQDAALAPVCGQIRARTTAPVVVLRTALDLGCIALLEDSADLVLQVPVGQRELLARIRAVLRRSPSRPVDEPAISFGGMKLDRIDRILHLRNGSLELDDVAYALIEALILNAPRMVRRSSLRDTLSMSDSQFDGHVRRLRDRIEGIDGWRQIVTVRGVGLRLLEPPPAIDLR